MKLIFLTENISKPIDEGIKKYSFKLAYYINRNFTASKIFTCYKNTSITRISKLPNNKLLFSFHFLNELFKLRKHKIIYVPNASSTFMSFIRLKLIKFWSVGAKSVMISVQKRQHKLIQKLIIKHFLKPNLMFVFSEKEKQYYSSLNINVQTTSAGVDTEKYKPISSEEKNNLRKELGYLKDDKIILHVGHINKGRNISVFKKFKKLGYKPIIVGSTCFTDDINLKQELKNSGIIIIDTYLKNINEYYQIADAYVFPVLSEKSVIEFPLSVLEAMSCNIPVVSTNYGSLNNHFEETDSFKYFHSEEELFNKLKIVIGNKSTKNRELILKNFSWDTTFNSLLNNIEKI